MVLSGSTVETEPLGESTGSLRDGQMVIIRDHGLWYGECAAG